jgi:hypothetical protein
MIVEKRSNHSNQLLYTVEQIDTMYRYKRVLSLIEKEFQLTPTSDILKIGLDSASKEFQIDGSKIYVDWDIYFGLSIIAKDEKAKDIVKKIARYMKSYQEERLSLLDRFKHLLF